MQAELPGLNPRRLVGLMRAAIDRCALDLSGFVVFTEAASGAYAVTPVLAAMAGAKHVFALAKSTRYGSMESVAEKTLALAIHAGVNGRVEALAERARTSVAQADIVTNSGHVRPIDAEMISMMKPTSVIPLMYETWELREGDIDLAACRKRGTNERHPAVDVFSFLGTMAVKLLLDAGVAVLSSRILVVCDNPFGTFIERGLAAANAKVEGVRRVSDGDPHAEYDAVLLAVTPTGGASLADDDIKTIAANWPGAVVAVYWGDVDREALDGARLSYWPAHAPPRGHMGILPSGVGPEPIVRLQCGSLKAAEALLRYSSNPQHPAHEFGQPL
jgi:hypothetical protein